MVTISTIVGIDFGTSTSEIAVLQEGKPVVIPNHLGELITPSVIGYSENGKMLVGREARDQLLLRPRETLIEVKRMMGSTETITMGGQEYTPQQAAAVIIAYLVDCARRHLGEPVDEAVITVPAYFSDVQRRATMEAGRLAGVKVERIINEPTAAALDYGIEHMQECRNILVYDLGGGTLDVTVLEMFEGVLDVKASCGNNRLGGKDFDQRLIDYLLERLRAQYGIDPSGDLRAMARLKEAAEKCKIDLSSHESHHLLLPFFAAAEDEPISLEETVTRDVFEGLIKGLIDATSRQIQSALGDARLEAADLDLVLLVGGSTRIPYVRQFIEETLGQEPLSLVDPDLAVVRGAAVQAGILSDQLSTDTDILITDVCPYTLGTSIVAIMGGLPVTDTFDVIIPRNVTIPVVKEKVYGTVTDNQTEVEINVYQGEYRKASYNNFLGRFILEGVPPAPAFKEKINISFAYDVNGILQVEGTILSTGAKANLVIETMGMTMEPEIDLSGWEKKPNARRYKAIIKKALEMIDRGEALVYVPEMESLVRKIKTGLVQGENRNQLDKYKDELHETIFNLSEVEDD